MTNGVHGSCNGLEGFDLDSSGPPSLAHALIYDRVQPEVHKVQERVEPAHNAHQETGRGPQQHAQDQEQAAKDPDTERDALLSMRRRKKEEIARARQERRRRENERRLEGQRRENERILEARRKAEEEAAAATAAARAQSESGEHSNQDRDEPAEGKERKAGAAAVAAAAAAKVDDQNVDAQTAVGSLEHDSGAAHLVITEEEHSESHLMGHLMTSAAMCIVAPPSPPITPRRTTSPPSGYGDGFSGLCEDLQTGMESNYLFDPPLRWTTVPTRTPLPLEEHAQTCEVATDVLFERSGGGGCSTSTGPVIPTTPKVKICHAAWEGHAPQNGVSRTTRNAHESQRERGRGGGRYRRGRGG